MGLILDTSLFIAEEKGILDMPAFLRRCGNPEPAICAITVSELLHGAERATHPNRKARRSEFIERVLRSIRIIEFGLNEARCHAKVWADLER